MEISAQQVKSLREQSGAGIMDCRNALTSCKGNVDKALEILKEKGLTKAAKKSNRATGSGLIESYIHTAGRIGSIIEVNCETDFVARTDEFKEMAHCLAMQVAAMNPKYISEKDIPEDKANDVVAAEVCLMLQPFIKDPTKTIGDVVTETIAKTGENIKISRFLRYELGE
ncbi:MAG: translation elongation factor Ts [Dehalococcoidales bacterium]|nr:translation elongation factor Ts [Dehalococcoidales bacterium]